MPNPHKKTRTKKFRLVNAHYFASVCTFTITLFFCFDTSPSFNLMRMRNYSSRLEKEPNSCVQKAD